jgi:hypothetical protein
MTEPVACAKGGNDAAQRPNRLETISMIAIAAALVIYLPLLLHRTANGLGDVQVFFRAAWAVWTGYPLYQVVDNHGWSYHYPPTFAILMGPFADPLPGYPAVPWALPFAASVGIFYALSIAAMVLAAHIWAKALEDHSGIALPQGQTGWWTLRIAPVLLLAPYFGASFARGQPTTILILLVCIFLKLYADRRVVTASAALALAIAIKIFPAAFLIIPLLRRDLRTLVWTAAWCAVFLFALPALVLGLDPTIELYRTLWIERLSGIAEGDLAARVAVEISPWSNDMVAFGSMLGRTFSAPAADAPHRLPEWVQVLQLAFDLLIIGLIVVLGRGRFWNWSSSQPDRPYAILVAGAVILAALPAMLPVAQPHYWAHAAPLFAVLIVEHWRRRGTVAPSMPLIGWAIVACLAYIATGVTLWEPLRNHGPTTLVMLVLIAAGFVVLARAFAKGQQGEAGSVPTSANPV